MVEQKVQPQAAFEFNETAATAPKAERRRHAGPAKSRKIHDPRH